MLESVLKSIATFNAAPEENKLFTTFSVEIKRLLNVQSVSVLKLLVTRYAEKMHRKPLITGRDILKYNSEPVLIELQMGMRYAYYKKKVVQRKSQKKQIITFSVPLVDKDEVFYITEVVFKIQDLESIKIFRQLIPIFSNHFRVVRAQENDFLTSLYNRQAFNRITSEFCSNIKKNKALDHFHYLAILDLDNFKNVNDTYGHMIGDEVLIIFARIMRQNIRTSDMVFRWGGEEFIIIIENTPVAEAHMMFDRLRGIVERQNFPQAGKVTVSVGYSQFSCPVDFQEVLDKSDRALYYSKEHGRNNLYSYEALIEEQLIEPVSEVEHSIDIW